MVGPTRVRLQTLLDRHRTLPYWSAQTTSAPVDQCAARAQHRSARQTDPNRGRKAWGTPEMDVNPLRWYRLCLPTISFASCDSLRLGLAVVLGLRHGVQRQLGDRASALLECPSSRNPQVAKSLCSRSFGEAQTARGLLFPPPPQAIAMVARRQGFSPADAWKLSSPTWLVLPAARRFAEASPPFRWNSRRCTGCPAPMGEAATRIWSLAVAALWPVLLVRQPYHRAIALTETAPPHLVCSQGYRLRQDVRGRWRLVTASFGRRFRPRGRRWGHPPLPGPAGPAWIEWADLARYGFSYQ